jgi:hypothetical protein
MQSVPPVAFLGIRFEAAVDLRHHRHVAVAELPGNELKRCASACHPYRPVVPGIMQAAAGEPKSPTPLPMRVTDLARCWHSRLSWRTSSIAYHRYMAGSG